VQGLVLAQDTCSVLGELAGELPEYTARVLGENEPLHGASFPGTTVQVATPTTASEFRGGIIGVTLRPVSGADFVNLTTDEHLSKTVVFRF